MSEADVAGKKRMIVVSNRLPFTVRQEAGILKFIPSVGGIATGLSSYLESLKDHTHEFQDCLWVGWPGSSIGEEKIDEVRTRSLAEFNAVPIFLSEENIEDFYQGFCNETIWPLFHYFQVYTHFDDSHWAHYIEVNRAFCRTLIDLIRPDDTLWIHDYHLMLLPAMIRQHLPDVTIGFFLHIPFPSYEIFRLLPSTWRREILKGMLGADLIAFHTNDYRQDFLRCVLRILGYDPNMGEIIVGDRIIKAETLPMGIDYRKYNEGAAEPAILRKKQDIQKRLGDAKIILSIDRLDYTKGIVNRLEAFQTFLENFPSWRRKVVLLLIVVPSRVDVKHYEVMKNQIETLVGRINGQFGSPEWTPIVYMYKSLTFSPLIEMYASSHIALITPLRDGMNLIAKEYIASRVDKTGVLILSEMAGASKELLEAVITNPGNRNEIAEAILEALQMPEEEQIRRNTIMQQRLRRYDVVRWATDFMEELANANRASHRLAAKTLNPDARSRIMEHYHRSSRRLFLLDYDGTLVPFANMPHKAVPGQSLLRILRDLSQESCNEVVIVSGRERDFLEQWFSSIPISLVAEHGAWIKEKGSDWQMTPTMAAEWKPKLKPLFERYVDRIAGSFIEEKDFALVWHYRATEFEQGKLAAQELKDHLLALTANIDVHILQGNRTVEARVGGVNKGTGCVRFLSGDLYDFILCIGDDVTDEDLFAILPDTAYSIRVGVEGGTSAHHTIGSVEEVIRFLDQIALPDDQAISPAG
ncbi:MAG: bifunctional alpha,alpha-trehalose-phosphate synthase (UDP-forming)/trehalose-phosphatase [Acidobacteria bacterium]|nr:bifunctional alpha,alpha-trehalose-phosphate synthase (UDP-forming)/trehalose-phosphatase [Acidobacteriota bacterium]